jgi:hypothetical protein
MALWPAAYGKAASQAGHMAAPTSAVQILQKIFANGAPSTHGLIRLFHAPDTIPHLSSQQISLSMDSAARVAPESLFLRTGCRMSFDRIGEAAMTIIPHEVACVAISADCFRFPQSADFERWFGYPALIVEEIAALSCDRDPKVLNPKRIADFKLSIPHPALARTPQDLMDFSALANVFEQRRDFLLRACRHSDLPATPVGDTYEVRLADFFPWLDRQSGRDPWDLLPDGFEERAQVFRAAASDTEKEKTDGSSFGVSLNKKGQDACRAYLKSEMLKSLGNAAFNGRAEYALHCTKKYGISKRAFFKIWTGVATETKCAWAKRGRRSGAA